jgi:hypothetical protein
MKIIVYIMMKRYIEKRAEIERRSPMNHAGSFLLIVTVLATIFIADMGTAADYAAPVSIRFPAFSLSPGEKITGITVHTSQGRLFTGCLPGRWGCEYKGSLIHCFSLHPQYAIALTGLLPEIIVRDISGSGSQLAIEASIEYLDDNGKGYSKEFKTSELIVK